jgi:hypothetical protein
MPTVSGASLAIFSAQDRFDGSCDLLREARATQHSSVGLPEPIAESFNTLLHMHIVRRDLGGCTCGRTARARIGSAGLRKISRRTKGVRAVAITRRAKRPLPAHLGRRACSRSTRSTRPRPHSLRRLRPVCGCVRELARTCVRARYAHACTHKADCTHTRACARVCMPVCVYWCPRQHSYIPGGYRGTQRRPRPNSHRITCSASATREACRAAGPVGASTRAHGGARDLQGRRSGARADADAWQLRAHGPSGTGPTRFVGGGPTRGGLLRRPLGACRFL